MAKPRRVKKSYTQIPSFFEPFEGGEKHYIEEKKPLSIPMLKILTTPQSFTKLSKSGKVQSCTIYFSESLQKLIIEKQSANYILTTNILGAVKDSTLLSKQLHPQILSANFVFCIHTTQKTLEFVADIKNLRDEFVLSLNTLVKLSKEYMSANGLKNYCESIIESENSEEILKPLAKSRQYSAGPKTFFKQSQSSAELQVIQGVINNLIYQVEILQKSSECSLIQSKIKNNSKNRSNLSVKQENLRSLISKQELEITSFKSKIQTIEKTLEQLKKPGSNSDSNKYSLKIWSNIMEFLKAKEIVVLRVTSHNWRVQTNKVLLIKPIWRKLCLTTLSPRRVLYRIYMRNFYKTEIRGLGYEVDMRKAEEIKNDVWKGLNEYQKETEEILLELCKYNPNLDYCQGMHFVCNILFGMYRNTQEVLRIMDSLCRPPFYLSELWKNDLSRLKLGIYQLEFLMRIRLPLFAKHLKELEINLDMIVTRWFLTVFTHLHFQYEMPQSIVFEIWDFFLLQGWPALISTCLAFFYLTQNRVIGKSYEETLTVLTSRINFSEIFKVIPLFEVDPRILEDLDGSYATVLNN